jgi:AcrR family transcriptional regulator
MVEQEDEQVEMQNLDMAISHVRRRLSVDARRAQIIETATALISATGYNSLTLSNLADACGLTRAGLSHHFPTKEDVFIAVLAHRDEVDAAALEIEPNSVHNEDELLEAMRKTVVRNSTQPEIVRLYTILSAEALDPRHPAHLYFANRLATSRSTFAESVRTWHPEPDLLAIKVLSFMDGLQLNWIRDPAIDLTGVWDTVAPNFLARETRPERRVKDTAT